MSNEIKPEVPATEIDAFKLLVDTLENVLKLELHEDARKFLVEAHVSLTTWLITKRNEHMTNFIATLVGAVIHDESVAVVLGAYIAWSRQALKEYDASHA